MSRDRLPECPAEQHRIPFAANLDRIGRQLGIVGFAFGFQRFVFGINGGQQSAEIPEKALPVGGQFAVEVFDRPHVVITGDDPGGSGPLRRHLQFNGDGGADPSLPDRAGHVEQIVFRNGSRSGECAAQLPVRTHRGTGVEFLRHTEIAAPPVDPQVVAGAVQRILDSRSKAHQLEIPMTVAAPDD